MVIPFANVLPFGEVTAGALILFGLFTRAGLVLSGLLLVGLTFGTVMLGDAPTVAHNAVRVRKFCAVMVRRAQSLFTGLDL
jgi:thiosulfate dehydrogenase (quinone) large subunit